MSVVGLKSLDVSPSNELLLLPMIVKNCFASEYFFLTSTTFGVHYRTGSPGQLQGSPGRWITGSLGHKMEVAETGGAVRCRHWGDNLLIFHLI